MPDYEMLRLIWWLIMGVLLVGFSVMDGFDLGVVGLLPFIGKTDQERRIVINTVGPVWEGNQVWFILTGGVFFAAWPYLYAVLFSGFYLAMFLLLLTFIIRPVGFKYRSKVMHPKWRSFWDWALCIAATVAMLVFGVAVGNILQGVPFSFDDTLRVTYAGTLWGLFNPFALLCGIASVCMLYMQGAAYLCIKTTGVLYERVKLILMRLPFVLVILFCVGGIWLGHLNGYVLADAMDHFAPSNPLHKSVHVVEGAWFINFHQHPLLWIAPVVGILGPFFIFLLIRLDKVKSAFFASSLGIAGVIATVGCAMFPFILPSSTHPSMSLMVWDASASELSLTIMLVCTVIFLPIVLAYTAWVYRVLKGKVTEQFVEKNESAY